MTSQVAPEKNMKAYVAVGVQRLSYLTSALDESEWSASRYGRFTSREVTPGVHWMGGRVGRRNIVDIYEKLRQSSSPRPSH